MAKISPTFPFNNSFGDYSVYKMHGVDRLVIRAKHGPNKEALKTILLMQSSDRRYANGNL